MTATLGPALTVPAPPFAHLARLSDDTGLCEHARHGIVRREHGYCTDDVARGLVVAAREPEPSALVSGLAERYLGFLTHAQGADGAFHNRLGYDRRWQDAPGLGDWWGRALWGLGTAVAHSPAGWIRQEALVAFRLGASRRSPAPRAMAFAGLGAAEVLRARPGDPAARALLADAASAIVGAAPPYPLRGLDWVWPDDRLTYANAALAEVVIAAGQLGGDAALRDAGLRMLTWLCAVQTRDDRLSVVPVAGWRHGGPRPRHDQQPIEVAALADACATAAGITGDPAWEQRIRRCADWFLGENDGGVPMWDPETGGGYDGLTPGGPNLNQGAESTLALVATLQHARRWS
ncbi:glycosyltransferase [Catenuloplanes japonicus]|uniref:glycosyltransferase n=1 Tax=Catenuloplanes japonicus TaxID=33876 RepID=UPI000B29CC1E|nr:glycosyltransferase [Catenuloplanes japonicus]